MKIKQNSLHHRIAIEVDTKITAVRNKKIRFHFAEDVECRETGDQLTSVSSTPVFNWQNNTFMAYNYMQSKQPRRVQHHVRQATTSEGLA